MTKVIENLGKKIASMNIVANTFTGLLPITFIAVFFSNPTISFGSLFIILFLSYFNGLIIFHLSNSMFSLLKLNFEGDYVKEIYKDEPNNYLIVLMQKAIIYRSSLVATMLNFLLFLIILFFTSNIALFSNIVAINIYMVIGMVLIIFLLVIVIFFKAYINVKNKIEIITVGNKPQEQVENKDNKELENK